mmetsp:Transcript_77883/g.134972  ORF Transcript_77883/g.134972 Transcript_77883/m.134972 type:complete len:87 (+) Transcript_77883:13-273(+)
MFVLYYPLYCYIVRAYEATWLAEKKAQEKIREQYAKVDRLHTHVIFQMFDASRHAFTLALLGPTINDKIEKARQICFQSQMRSRCT